MIGVIKGVLGVIGGKLIGLGPKTIAEISPIRYHFDGSLANTTADAVDPAINRVTSLTLLAGTLGLNVTQATVANQPILVDGIVRFDGNDRLSTPAGGVARNVAGFTMVTRFKAAPGVNTGVRQLQWALDNTANNGRAHLSLLDGKLRAGGRRISTDATVAQVGTTQTDNNAWHVGMASFSYSTGVLSIYLDGAVEWTGAWQAQSTANSADTNAALSIGANNNTTEGFIGDISDTLAFSAALTAEDAMAIKLALDAKWAPPETTVVVNPVSSFNKVQTSVLANRQYYPGADPDLNHLPAAVRMNSFGFREKIPTSQGGWPTIYWVSATSQFASPNGEYVHRNRQLIPTSSTALANAIGPNYCAWVIVPPTEKFSNISDGIEWNQWRGLILQGVHHENTQWIGRTDVPVFRSAADAEARTTPYRVTSTFKGGKWYYNGTYRWDGVGAVTTGNADTRIDNTNDLRQAVYGSNAGSTVNPNKELTFTAIEGMRIAGPYTPEGLNTTWAGWTANHRIVISGLHVDRTSVYYKKAADGVYDSKEPGGDPGQFFGNARDLIVDGYTAAQSALQGIFVQISQNWDSANADYDPRMVVVHNLDIHGLEAGAGEEFGSTGGNQWTVTWDRPHVHSNQGIVTQFDLQNVSVWQTGKSRAALIFNESQWPEIEVRNAAYNAPPEQTGNGYVAPENVNIAQVRVDPAKAGPTVPETDPSLAVLNGNQTITTDGYILENKIVNGYIIVKANNVKIRNVYQKAPAYAGTTKQFGIKCSDVNATTLVPYTGLEVSNVSLSVPVANRNVYQGTGIAGGNYTISDSVISGYVDGWGVWGVASTGVRRSGTINRVYVHDLPYYAVDPDQTDGSHNDGGQDQGLSKLIVTNSVIYGGYTSALLVQQTIDNTGTRPNHESVLIDNNLLGLEMAGGSVVNISESGKGVVNNLTITNNDFDVTYPAAPRIILPNTTRDAPTTVISGNKDINGNPIVTTTGG